MQKFEDSFDGKFEDNLKSNAKGHTSHKSSKIVINVADTQYAVVKHIAKKYKWALTVEPLYALNFDICWSDNHLKSELFARMQQHQKINHIPGMAVLSRKNSLGRNLMLFRKRFQLDYDFFPLTWNLPNDFPELADYHDNRQQGKAQTFIVKPQASCQGKGIFLTRNIEKIKNDRCVVQRYMHKPYLLDGLKFDLRIYVLITGVDPLRIFVFEEGLARFATETYRPPRSDNLQNQFIHLTNYAINKDHPNFIFNESVNQMDFGHKRSLSSIYKQVQADGGDSNFLKQRINDIFIKTIITGYPALSRSFLSVHPDNFANDMCFQILGFDIMLDYKLNPSLIEVNYTPSFTADSPLDRFIKKKLIQDTISLVGITEKWKAEQKRKRDREIQERMVTGKRKKYSLEERKYLLQEFMKKRNDHQDKILGSNSSNGFSKIFVKNKEQFESYQRFYDFAQEIHRSQGSGLSYNYNMTSSYLANNKCENLYKFYYESLPQNNSLKESNRLTNKSVIVSTIVAPKKAHKNSHNLIGSRVGQFQQIPKNKRVASAKTRNPSQNPKKRKSHNHEISSSKCLPINEADIGQDLSASHNVDFEFYLPNQSKIFMNKGLQNALLKKKRSDGLPLTSEDNENVEVNSNY